MNGPVPLRKKYQRQRGVTAIEFAILFPVFFSILYGIIQYGMIFAAQQTLTLAAEEGARAALQYQNVSTATASLSARAQVAQTACENMVGWLHDMSGVATSAMCPLSTPPTSVPNTTCPNGSMYCVQQVSTYPYGTNPLIPTVALLNWTIPNAIGSAATVQLDPANII